MLNATVYNAPPQPDIQTYMFEGDRSNLDVGYALCANPDASEVEDRFQEVEKPDAGNLDSFVGVLHQGSAGKTGPGKVRVCKSGATNVYTDQNISVGDQLVPQAGSYALMPTLSDRGVAQAKEAASYGTDDESGLVAALLTQALGVGVGAPAFELMEDFVEAYDSSRWTVTNTDGGADSGEVNTVSDEQYGVLTLTTNDAENDAEQHVLAQENVKLTEGDPLFYECRAQLDAATESDMSIGLIATEDLSGGTLIPTDGVVFKKDDGDTDIDVASSKDGTDETVEGVATMDTDYHRYGIYFDGDSTITFFFDGEEVATADTTICDDEELAPHFMVLAGDANARTLKTDYFRVEQSR